MRRDSQKGATLIEVLLAAALFVCVAITISLVFPKAAANITNNRRHFLAANFANSRLQELMSVPYPLLVPTTADAAHFPSGTGNPPADYRGCDCTQANFSAILPDRTYVADGITYTVQQCINLADRDPVTEKWIAYCPDNTNLLATDRGLKNIHIRVSWTVGPHPYTKEIDSMVSR